MTHYYNEITLVSWSLKSLATQLFVQQTDYKEKFMFHITGPLWAESTGAP